MPSVLDLSPASQNTSPAARFTGWERISVSPRDSAKELIDRLSDFGSRRFDAIQLGLGFARYYHHDLLQLLDKCRSLLTEQGFIDLLAPDLGAAMDALIGGQLDIDDPLPINGGSSVTVHDAIYGSALMPHRTGYSEDSLERTLLQAGFKHVNVAKAKFLLHAQAFRSEATLGSLSQARSYYSEGLEQTRLGKHLDAIRSYQRSLELEPAASDVLDALGSSYAALGCFQDALECFDQALSESSDDASLKCHRANALLNLCRPDETLTELDELLRLEPHHVEGLACYGLALSSLGQHQVALDKLNEAAVHGPSSPGVVYARGVVRMRMRQYEVALAEFRAAIDIAPHHTQSLYGNAAALTKLGRHDEAAESYRLLLELQPTYPFATGNLIKCQREICDWSDINDRLQSLLEAASGDSPVQTPLASLADSDDPGMQLRHARRFAQLYHPQNEELGPIAPKRRNKRIRIAYVSADFRDHPVSYLTAGLFEQHDHSKFELFGVSLVPQIDTEVGRRVAKSFDEFIDVSNMSDREVASMLRDLGIDIAVDLMGHTELSRLSIFARRAAPIQVSYLGYPATTGAPYMDYILADSYVIPESLQSAYSESVVYLPHCFQVNDEGREIDSNIPSRSELGLPENGFVFCCFNNNYKITPELFDIWMDLLKKVDKSVLWVLGRREVVCSNLRRQAKERKVDPARLVFAGQLPYREHLARFQQADLFLDTFPFNAGTTASDALWAGLPLLSCSGKAFAARMAGSLLHELDLGELATQSLAEYRDKALELAENPEYLGALRRKLAANRMTSPVFDTGGFARRIEAAYLSMLEEPCPKS
jgi:predicted O-linked N-acetylglucosamine transferase (SPINDLY family)